MVKTHWMLCSGDDFSKARESVLVFFDKSILLSYNAIEVVEKCSWPAATEMFWTEIENGVAGNRLVLQGFLDELRSVGCRDLDDLTSLSVGYPSKLLHLVAHLVDGFIGIDSVFYNMVEDSHWLSDGLRATIRNTPARYWLLRVDASFMSETDASFIHIPPNNK